MSTCADCGEAIRLDTAGPEMGVLAGASVWVHERFYPFGMEPHEPFPGSPSPSTRTNHTNRSDERENR